MLRLTLKGFQLRRSPWSSNEIERTNLWACVQRKYLWWWMFKRFLNHSTDVTGLRPRWMKLFRHRKLRKAKKRPNMIWKFLHFSFFANSLVDDACYLLSSIAIYINFLCSLVFLAHSLVFIQHFPLNWLSFEYRRRSRQRSHWRNNKKKSKVIPRKEISLPFFLLSFIFFARCSPRVAFYCFVLGTWKAAHDNVETPKKFLLTHECLLWLLLTAASSRAAKSEIYLRWNSRDYTRFTLRLLSCQRSSFHFVCTFPLCCLNVYEWWSAS